MREDDILQREPDVLDQANNLAQKLNDAHIAAARAKSKAEQVQNADGTWPVTECVDCGIDIPPARLALAKIRCVHCQGDLEKRGGR